MSDASSNAAPLDASRDAARKPASRGGAPKLRLFLVDGSALAYRSHFAFIRTPLSNASGLSTGGIFGYVRGLIRVLEEERPTHVAVVFDTEAPTFRHDIFPDYKATRQKMPDELAEQLPWMKSLTRALGVRLIEIDGIEADDVIGTLATRAGADGWEVMMVSPDKDFMQLVTDRVKLYNNTKGGPKDVDVVDPKGVEEKFGVPPERIVDLLALMGDASDNVPGVTGIGGKTAAELVATWGSLDAILANAEQDRRKRVRENLLAQREQALLSRRLVTIDTDVPLELRHQDLVLEDRDFDRLIDLFRELEFNTLLEGAIRSKTASVQPVAVRYETIANAAQLEALIAALRERGAFVFDTETTGLDPIAARVVGLSFSIAAGRAWYVPLNATPPLLPDAPGSEPGAAVLERLRPLLEDPEIGKTGQNVKFDFTVLLNHGIEVRGIAFDTMLASYVIDAGAREHDLDSLAMRHFHHRKIPTEDLIGRGRDQITMDLLPVDRVSEYACEDADFTFRLADRFEGQLGDGEMRKLFEEIELPLIPVLARMERQGVRVDVDVLAEQEREIEDELARLEGEIHAAAGRPFNIGSPKQLSEVLFVELELHQRLGVRPKRTKTGFSTSQEILEAMTGHELPRKILDHRSLAKLLGTYVQALPRLVNPLTGRIHTHFNQTVAATGRLSSSDPNLQNIPIRSERGRRIRESFVPWSEDNVLLAADYSQVELRIMAHVAGDEVMIAAFARGADIHRETAARVFGVAPEAVDGAMRARAKSINFGVMYGMGPQRLARETGLTLEEAQTFIRRYFETFPAVRAWIDGTIEKARRESWVETVYGRRRPILDINSSNGRLRAAAENMAVNTPIQGTAADLIKIAMIRIDAWIRERGLGGRMILQVHDELVFDVPRAELEVFRSEVPRIMTGVAELRTPLVVDTGIGRNWSEAH